MIQLAAPEEHRLFKDFAKACKPSLNEAWSAAKDVGWYPEFKTAKQWFDWCWQQADAEQIHKAFAL